MCLINWSFPQYCVLLIVILPLQTLEAVVVVSGEVSLLKQ